jgi:hypothetical protein
VDDALGLSGAIKAEPQGRQLVAGPMTGRLHPVARRRGFGWVLAALATGAALAVPPVSAEAAVTLGSALATEPTGAISCIDPMTNRGCLAVQDVLPGHDLVAPFDGVIVRWRVRLGDGTEAQSVRIRVVRRVDADTFTAISSGGLESVPAGAGTYTFPAQLAIRGGDQLAIEGDSGTVIEWLAPAPGGRSFQYFPTPADGVNTGAPTTYNDFEYTFNVDVEPDCDSDGRGDETQDSSLFGGGCPPQDRTLTLDANKSKVKKGKTVTFLGQVNSSGDEPSCESGQTVELQRKKPTQADFATFDQVPTYATGDFSAKEKVKKTFDYRVQVAETATCHGQASNTEKVKVKKKK